MRADSASSAPSTLAPPGQTRSRSARTSLLPRTQGARTSSRFAIASWRSTPGATPRPRTPTARRLPRRPRNSRRRPRRTGPRSISPGRTTPRSKMATRCCVTTGFLAAGWWPTFRRTPRATATPAWATTRRTSIMCARRRTADSPTARTSRARSASRQTVRRAATGTSIAATSRASSADPSNSACPIASMA